MSDSKIEVRDILDLVVRAERAEQPNLARELVILAGRMDRTFGDDHLDPDEHRDAAYARGVLRLLRSEAKETAR